MTALTHRSSRRADAIRHGRCRVTQPARLILSTASTAWPDLLRLFTRAGLPRANRRLNPQDDESRALSFRPHLLSSRIILVTSLLLTARRCHRSLHVQLFVDPADRIGL